MNITACGLDERTRSDSRVLTVKLSQRLIWTMCIASTRRYSPASGDVNNRIPCVCFARPISCRG